MTSISHASGWRRYVRPGVLVLITGISLYLLLPSLIVVFGSWRSLRYLTWYWAVLALVGEAASFALLWQLDRLALHVRSWFVVGSAQLAGNAIGKIVPGGGATATAAAVDMLRRAGVGVGQAASALAAATSLQVGTRLALPVLALPAILGGTRVAHGLATAAYLGLAVVVLLVVAGVLAFAFDRPLASTGRGLQRVLNGTVRRRRKITDLPEQLLAERDFVRGTIGEHWRAALLSAIGSTAFDFGALLCALRAVGADPQPSLVVLAYAGAGLLALIPLTPGGLGFVEAGLVGTLTLAGVPANDAVLATLTYRLVSYWLPIPVGGIAYIMFSRRYPSRPGLRGSRTASARSPIRDHWPAEQSQAVHTNQGGSSMDSIVERAGQMAGTELKRVRWALGINGVLSVAFAVVILIWPGISLFALAIVFGAFTAANGVVGLIAAIRGPAISGRGWLVLSSLVSIAFGVAVLVRTDLSALALLYVVGAYAISLGIITIGGGFWLPLNGGDRALLTLTGMISVLFGIVMFAKPGAGALVLLALIAAYELVKGISELVVSIGWKRLFEHDLKQAVESMRAKPQAAS